MPEGVSAGLLLQIADLLLQIDRSAAKRRAAPAGYILDILREMVIDRELLAFANRPTAHIEDVALTDDRHNIRIAAVVDVLRAAAAYGAIQRPVVIEREEINHPRLFVAAALCLPAADTLAFVLDDLPAGRDILSGVNSPAVNLRGLNNKSETGKFRIDHRLVRRLACGHLLQL